MQNRISALACLCLWLVPSCAFAGAEPVTDIAESAGSYFDIYAKRQDFKQFLAFYHPQAVLEDLVYGDRVEGRDALAAFFAWDKGRVKVVDNKPVLHVAKQVVADTDVITKGYFNKFEYQGQVLGPWRFIIYQRFNHQGQIVYQEDWINYTPKSDYSGGKNLNPK